MKLKEEKIERNKKDLEILQEVNKCKAAIYKLWKQKLKIHITYNHEREVETNDVIAFSNDESRNEY